MLYREGMVEDAAPRISIGTIAMEAADPPALAGFWGALLHREAQVGDGAAFLPGNRPGEPGLLIQPLTGPRPERQISHPDLFVPDGSRTAEASRAVDLGATFRWEVLDEYPGVRWSTLADPEGNLFCIAEHEGH
ncbi:hypothetical protein EDD31_0617 [Bogoriella caseilytica]|uniref:Glyoxalase-like domain-containing protein n=2 Tax=Bogoriella caseilytica TaxID=56055 RepID=A0A3N2BAJ7_9MICO|nr:hypothetical protein EDD31_0617 [Bogoriella caseilytica]